MAATVSGTTLNVIKAHDLLGHCSKEMTQAATKLMGWVLTGSWKPCKSCAAVKARKKNGVLKESEHIKAVKGENYIFLDIATL